MQQQVVRDRSTVFLMLSRMLTEKLEIVKKVSTLFTMTLIQAADNETDPRNLLVIFNMKLSVLNLLPVEHHYEDIFDSLSVYFPVDFTPPSGVVASVTKQQLQASLRAAISHHTLQEWSLDLIMEKLESDLESAKIDSLETLAEICSKSEPVMHTDEVVSFRICVVIVCMQIHESCYCNHMYIFNSYVFQKLSYYAQIFPKETLLHLLGESVDQAHWWCLVIAEE